MSVCTNVILDSTCSSCIKLDANSFVDSSCKENVDKHLNKTKPFGVGIFSFDNLRKKNGKMKEWKKKIRRKKERKEKSHK